MSDIASRAVKLKKGEILPITFEELKEIVEDHLRCGRKHKVVIDHFGQDDRKKGRRRVARFGGTAHDAKTLELKTVRVRFGERDELEIPPHCIWGVDRRGNLYADLTKQ